MIRPSIFKAIKFAAAVATVLTLSTFSNSQSKHVALKQEPTTSQSYATRPIQDDVFYFFMPIAWRNGGGGNNSNFGDFKGMTASLPYLQWLGITAVWMTPIYPATAYHGYQYSDGGTVNPWFGPEADFRAFVHAAHQAGIKVFIDFVAYGISQSSTFYQSAYNNLASPDSNMFAWTNAAHTQSNSAYSYTTWNGSPVSFAYWNMTNPQAANQETQWAEYWANQDYGAYTDAGVDGLRCDHAVDTFDAFGPNGLGYTTANFWTPLKQQIKALHPNFFIFGEQNDWGLYGNQYEPPFDAMFTKPLLAAVRSSLAAGTDDAFQSTLATTVATSPLGTYLCVFGDHDEDRLMSDIGDTFAKGAAAASLEMAQPYPPIIYYGDEIGMHGATNGSYSGDASAIPEREPFKWNAVQGSPMSNYVFYNTQAYNGRVEKDNDGRSVQEQQPVATSLLNTYKKLISIRKGSTAMLTGTYEPIVANNDNCTAFVRRSGSSAVLVVTNFSGTAQTFTVDLSGYTVPGDKEGVKDLISGMTETALTTSNKPAYPVTLSAHGYVYLTMTLAALPSFFPRADGYLPAVQRPGITFYQNQQSSVVATAQLDEGRLLLYGTHLYMGFTGCVDLMGGNDLVILINSASGGQNVLNLTGATQAGIEELNGTKLPTGFFANAMAVINVYSGVAYVDWYSLPSNGPAVHTFRGSQTPGRLFDQITGGTNPNLVEVGVLDNLIAANTPYNSVNTGFEMAVSLADIPGTRLPSGRVSTISFLVGSDGTVSNQFLPALPHAERALGIAPNLATFGVTRTNTYSTDLAAVAVTSSTLVNNTTTGTVYIAGPAAAGGEKVPLSSSSGNITVPASVVIPAGTYSANFTVSGTGSGNNATITAKGGDTTRTVVVSN